MQASEVILNDLCALIICTSVIKSACNVLYTQFNDSGY